MAKEMQEVNESRFNLARTPAIWRRMFETIPSKNFGLNYDPSHLRMQLIDPIAPIREAVRRLDSRADWTAGSRRATNTPMIAITTSNSTSVNARRTLAQREPGRDLMTYLRKMIVPQ
jgi:hypothetical protein